MSRVMLLSFFITLKRRMVATRVLCCWLNLRTCLRWRLDNNCDRFRPQMHNTAVECMIAQSALEFNDNENYEKKKERKKKKRKKEKKN